nr:12370_t:CDS:2 [Entrophospora candida]
MEKRRIRRLKLAELRRAREEQMDTINRAIDNNSEIKKNGIEYIKHFVEEIDNNGVNDVVNILKDILFINLFVSYFGTKQSTFTGFGNK